ncbi:MAG: NADH-quinone oxidoreductase subunit M [Planctomycetales bacterium]|nr:NADH-quinone oxidoreductase subunit M [Planctomycetales bacterium]
MSHVYLLTLIAFFPALGALLLAFVPGQNKDVFRFTTLLVTLVVLVLAVFLALPGNFDIQEGAMQNAFSLPWIPSFDIHYFMGVDGISLPLVVLTALVSVLACGASWSITKHVKAYCILFLLLEAGMLGVFMSLDFFLFYVFWEVMLLPMYFLIGVWGGPRKEYAAIKFFLYTLVGSVLMLIAILMLYFASDLRELSVEQLVASHVVSGVTQEAQVASAMEIVGSATPKHTFNILALQQMGQHTTLFTTDWTLWGISLQHWAFVLLFIGFAIKVPSVPVHTWLPDAHVEAPTPISMILAGVLLKMGGYGIIRMCYPICPLAGYDLAMIVCLIGVVSMVYGAFAALAQNDFKRMVAYSSVSHMGYVVLGLGVWSMGRWATGADQYDWQYFNMGVKGAMFQMIAHGISSAGMFFMVGVVYDRVHHRNLNEFGGLFGKMPGYTAMAMGLFFAGLGLPGLCGFIGEVLVVLSVWKFSILLAVISASVVVLTAAYILWAVQRVYLGAEYKGPHPEALVPMYAREWAVALPLFVLAIVFGVFPHQTVLKYMDKTIDQQTTALSEWTQRHVAEAPPPVEGAALPQAENNQAVAAR